MICFDWSLWWLWADEARRWEAVTVALASHVEEHTAWILWTGLDRTKPVSAVTVVALMMYEI